MRYITVNISFATLHNLLICRSYPTAINTVGSVSIACILASYTINSVIQSIRQQYPCFVTFNVLVSALLKGNQLP